MKRGFTLIELLVSIAIFSILVSIVAYAFRYSLDISKFLKYRYMPDLQTLSKLRDSIDSIYFYDAVDERKIKTEDKIFLFFKGKRSEVTYITVKPVLVKGYSLVISRIKQENDKLILEEYPLYSKDINYKLPSLKNVKTEKVVLFENLESVEFKYTDKDGKERVELKDTVPRLIKLTLRLKNRDKKVLFFKVKSDYYLREKIDEELYEGF